MDIKASIHHSSADKKHNLAIETLPQAKSCKKEFQANEPKKQAGVAILIFKKIDFEPILVRRDREGHIILMRGKIYQDELSILNT